MRKLLIALLAATIVVSMSAELFAQARRPGARARGNARRAQAEAQREERQLDRRLGSDEEQADPDDDRPLYPATQFNELQIRQETTKFIKKYDKDNDGVLNKYEFEGVEKGSTFELLDRNKNGKLDEDELRPYLRDTLPANKAKEIIDDETEKLMKKHDKNKDGKVTKDEFRGKDEDFAEIDENHDGVISEQEMRDEARYQFEDKHNARLPDDTSRFTAEAERQAAAAAAKEAAQKEAEARRAERQDKRDQRQNGGSGDEPKKDDGAAGGEPGSGK
ncbi:MAG: EF-hand domain-containing protein [Planctomycetota bacterium]